MHSLFALMIVAGISDSANGPRHPDAVEVFHCDFDKGWDENHDGFPDGWSRKHGAGFPHYLDIKLEPETTAAGSPKDDVPNGESDTTSDEQRYLAIRLNGGAASIYSPPIEIGSEFSYVLEAQLRTENLKHDRAFVTVTFYNAEREPLETNYSKRYKTVGEWTKLHVGPVAPPSKEAVFVVLGLHVHPTDRADVFGAAMFDSVWLAHLPRMTIETNSKHNIFSLMDDGRSDEVIIACKVSGILESNPEITFELVDISHIGVSGFSGQLKGKLVQRKSSNISNLPGLRRNPVSGFAGETKWSPTTVSPGFYRVRVTMMGSKTGEGKRGLMQQREVTFAVVRPEKSKPGGEFGWSLPEGDSKVSLDTLSELLSRSAVNWVKFPVWYGKNETDRANKLVVFAEQLSEQGIRMIGLLDKPPDDVRDLFGGAGKMYAADVFTTDPEMWDQSLEPVMTRLSSKISSWQLGLDQDTSFVGYPNVVNQIREVKRHLEKFGQRAHLGIGWRWMSEIPSGNNLAWDALALSADPPLTEAELDAYMKASKNVNFKRWITLEPLPHGRYTMEARAVDLVQRMMTAKMQGADGVFVPNPFSTTRGLMNDDGTPGELFLTWRTTALSLSGATYLGSIRLPSGSHNRIFSRGDDAVMVVWNEKPVKEVIYLGNRVRHIDIWGRHLDVKNEKHRQIIEVGPLPTFVMGVNEPIARMRKSFEFEVSQLPSIVGKEHPNLFRMKNSFPQGAGGTIYLNAPKSWKINPPKTIFKLATKEQLSEPFNIRLPEDANSGRQEVRIDFDITVDEPYQFSVYRHIDIGLGDVVITATTRLTEKGVLVVEQIMTNNTDRLVDFKCYLMAPGERRQRNTVFRLGRGKNVQRYRYPHGKELIGKSLWLKAEEVDGERVLNLSIIAKP